MADSSSKAPFRISQSVIWPLATFLGFAAVVTSGGYVFFDRLKQSDKAVSASALTTIGNLQAEQIRSYVLQEQNSALSIAQLLGQGELADWLSGAPTEMSPSLQALLVDAMRNGGSSGLLVLDADANPRFGAGQHTNLTVTGRDLARRAMTDAAPVTSDIYWGDPSAREQALLDFIIPIQRSARAPVSGALVLRDDLADLFSLLETWPVKSQTGESALVQLEGDHVLLLNELRTRKRPALRMQVPLSASRTSPGWPSIAAARGQTGIWEAYDYLNHNVLAYTLAVPAHQGWGLVVKVDLVEVFAQTQRLRNITIGVTTAFNLLAAVALGTWLVVLQRRREWEAGERQRISERNEELEQGVRERTAELERASLAARESEARTAGIIDSAMDAIISVNSKLCIVLFNRAAENMFGCRTADVLGQPLDRFVPQRFQGQHHRHVEQFGRTGVTGRAMGALGRISGVRANGEEFPVEASISQMTTGGEKLFTVILRDMTERHRAEEALQASQARYHSTLDNMLEAAQIFGFDWRYLYLNQAAARNAHQSKEELIGRTVMERFPGFEATEMFAVLHRCMVERTAGHTDFEFTYPDGTKAWFELSIQPVPEGLFILSLDITARKQADEAIRALNADLECRVQERTAQLLEANKELESFSSSVSHDLRAPLRHIQGYGEMLRQATLDGQLSQDAGRYLKTILEASAEMGTLIDDLLAFSRMGKVEIRKSRVSLDKLVQDAVRSLEMATNGRHIAWQIAELPPVVGDSPMVRQVLVNLIGNAVKYSRMRDPAQIEIGCAGEEDGRVILFVRDNGAGFDQQYAHKLFGVFQRLHRADEFEGTGIGLATVRRIVTRHGGRVWAEGALGHGATFYFTLQSPLLAA